MHLLPFVHRGVVVALSAFQIHAEKQPRDILGHRMVIRCAQKLHCRPRLTASRGADHLARQHIPTRLTFQLLLQKLPPFLVGHLAEVLPFQQHHRQPIRPVRGKGVAGQQLVNELGALVFRGIFQKRPHLGSRGNVAGQVQPYPPEKLRIVRSPRHRSASPGSDMSVNLTV